MKELPFREDSVFSDWLPFQAMPKGSGPSFGTSSVLARSPNVFVLRQVSR